MKMKLYILSALLIFSISSTAQNIPSYVPTNGLVGWWPFNGNANDESGNGNHGVVNGATLTSDRFGNGNGAYNFDGNDFIQVPYSSKLSVGKSSFTLSCWAVKTGNNDFQHLITRNISSGWPNFIASYNLRYQYDGVAFSGSASLISSSGNGGVSTTNLSNPNIWNHIVAIYDSLNGKSLLFINGLLVNAANLSLNTQAYDAGLNMLLYFGVENPSDNTLPSGPLFLTGKIDDIAIYNRALTQQEITNLYNGTLAAACPTIPPNLQTGLVGYWPFCGNANDESGNGNHGLVNGATLTSDRFGSYSKAFSYYGDNDYIEILTNNNQFNSQQYSISFWYKSNSPISQGGGNNLNPAIISRLTNNTNDIFDNLVIFEIYGGFNFNSGISAQVAAGYIFGNLYDSLWHQVTYSVAGDSCRTYFDGEKRYSQKTNGTINFTNYPFRFGRSTNSYWKDFSGELDDIAIWNRALSDQEVSQLFLSQTDGSGAGNIGVNVPSPQRNLHVKDVIRLEPRATAPENPVFGDMYIDANLKKLRVYDGTTWQNCW